MILEALGRHDEQCAVAGRHFGTSCCGLEPQSCVGGGETECDQTLRPDEITELLIENDIQVTSQEAALTSDQLDAQLAMNRPVLIWFEGTNSVFNHVMLVTGKQDMTRFIVADTCLDNFTAATHGALLTARGGWKRSWIIE